MLTIFAFRNKMCTSYCGIWSQKRMQHNSLGCILGLQMRTIAHQGASYLIRVHLSSLGCGVSHQGASYLIRVDLSSLGCGLAHQGASYLIRMHLSSIGCGLAHFRCILPHQDAPKLIRMRTIRVHIILLGFTLVAHQSASFLIRVHLCSLGCGLVH